MAENNRSSNLERGSQNWKTISMAEPEEDDNVCPMCMEEMDLTDKNFRPCTCEFTMCLLCWHHIKENLNGTCPGCRKPYDPENYKFTEPSRKETSNSRQLKYFENKPKKKKSIEKIALERNARKKPKDRKQLADLRVVQRNLVYFTNLPLSIAKEEVLQGYGFCGQYGKIVKIAINKQKLFSADSPTGPSVSAYITYQTNEEAIRAIQCLNGCPIEGRQLKASFGTTKYCTFFLKNTQCSNPDCMYLHDFGKEEDSYTKEEMTSRPYLLPEMKPIWPNDQQLLARWERDQHVFPSYFDKFGYPPDYVPTPAPSSSTSKHSPNSGANLINTAPTTSTTNSGPKNTTNIPHATSGPRNVNPNQHRGQKPYGSQKNTQATVWQTKATQSQQNPAQQTPPSPHQVPAPQSQKKQTQWAAVIKDQKKNDSLGAPSSPTLTDHSPPVNIPSEQKKPVNKGNTAQQPLAKPTSQTTQHSNNTNTTPSTLITNSNSSSTSSSPPNNLANNAVSPRELRLSPSTARRTMNPQNQFHNNNINNNKHSGPVEKTSPQTNQNTQGKNAGNITNNNINNANKAVPQAKANSTNGGAAFAPKLGYPNSPSKAAAQPAKKVTNYWSQKEQEKGVASESLGSVSAESSDFPALSTNIDNNTNSATSSTNSCDYPSDSQQHSSRARPIPKSNTSSTHHSITNTNISTSVKQGTPLSSSPSGLSVSADAANPSFAAALKREPTMQYSDEFSYADHPRRAPTSGFQPRLVASASGNPTQDSGVPMFSRFGFQLDSNSSGGGQASTTAEVNSSAFPEDPISWWKTVLPNVNVTIGPSVARPDARSIPVPTGIPPTPEFLTQTPMSNSFSSESLPQAATPDLPVHSNLAPKSKDSSLSANSTPGPTPQGQKPISWNQWSKPALWSDLWNNSPNPSSGSSFTSSLFPSTEEHH